MRRASMENITNVRNDLTKAIDLIGECRCQQGLPNMVEVSLEKTMGLLLNVNRSVQMAIEAPRSAGTTRKQA